MTNLETFNEFDEAWAKVGAARAALAVIAEEEGADA